MTANLVSYFDDVAPATNSANSGKNMQMSFHRKICVKRIELRTEANRAAVDGGNRPAREEDGAGTRTSLSCGSQSEERFNLCLIFVHSKNIFNFNMW